MRKYKDKNLAALLAFFGGIAGLHRFYLGQNGKGFLMILLSIFTMGILGSIIGVIDSIVFLSMSEETFDLRYNNPDEIIQRSPRYKSYERRQNPGKVSGNGHSPYRRDRRINKNEFRERKGETKSKKTRQTRSSTRRSPVKGSQKAPKNVSRTIKSLKEAGIEKFKEYDIEGSIQDFKKILEFDPYHIAAHFNLACAYSQLEKPQKTMEHISIAVKAGFNDFERIKKHDKLAFARIQPEWEEFSKNGFIFDIKEKKENTGDRHEGDPEKDTYEKTESRESSSPGTQTERTDHTDLLEHLKKLKEQREKAIITEVEFEIERRRLMSS